MDRNLLVPALAGGVLIVSLCFVEGFYLKDRWGTPGIEAQQLGQRFAQVPKQIGNWVGEDLAVDEVVQNTAGAVSYVSRLYLNQDTGAKVKLWLIVGHSRDICRHTPNICYPASGFRQDGIQIRHTFDLPGGKTAEFFTAKFLKDDAFGRQMERVFWAWNHPDINKWEAPDYQRQHYGLARALYKVYFTSAVMTTENTAEDNAAAEFAALMLPAIDKALFTEEPAKAESPAIESADMESADG